MHYSTCLTRCSWHTLTGNATGWLTSGELSVLVNVDVPAVLQHYALQL
jgi:hypothetical protein